MPHSVLGGPCYTLLTCCPKIRRDGTPQCQPFPPQILAASIAVFQMGTRGVLKRESAIYQKLFAGCEESISQVRTVVAFAGEEKEFSM